MKYEDFYKQLKDDYKEDKSPKSYRVVFEDGTKKVMRTFWSNHDRIAYHGKGMKTHGYSISYYPYYNIATITLIRHKSQADLDIFLSKRIKKRMLAAKAMLEKSGLWQDILKEINDVLSMGEDTIMEIAKAINMGSYEHFYKEATKDGKFPFIHTTQVFESFASKRCWTSIPYEREIHQRLIREAIKNGTRYGTGWHGSYDYYVEVSTSKEDGKARGWFSAEYKNCGNGHYYLLFDESHAIFYEDD